MGKETFIIYTSYYKPISMLSDKQLGRLFRAIFKYNLGEVVSVEEDIRMAFEFFKNQFEIDESKYQAKIKRDTENGRKGGNPNFKRGNKNPYYMEGITQDNPPLSDITQDNPPLSDITQDNPPLSDITQDNPIYDNDNVNDKEIISDDIIEKEKSFSPPSPAREGGKKGDMAGLKDLFNDTFAGKLQAIRSITPSRERAVRARIVQYGAEAVSKVFGLILDSPFLLGDNDRNWRADFDWIFKQQNFTKILEGNYERKQRTPDSGSGDTAAARRKREAEAVFARLCAEDG